MFYVWKYITNPESPLLLDQLHYVLCLGVCYKSRKSSTTPLCIITRPATLCFMSGSILQIPKVCPTTPLYILTRPTTIRFMSGSILQIPKVCSTTPLYNISRPATLCFMSGSILQIPKVFDYSSMHYY